ncbi:MAG: phage tail assembly protein [Candidatus Sulfotelmatobacter sp.]
MDALSTDDFGSLGEPEPDTAPRTLDMDIDVTFQKKRFTSLHLEEPTAKMLERAEIELNTTNPTPYTMRRYQIALVASVAQVPREVVLELRHSQLQEAFDFLAVLLDRSPKDGGT